MAKVATYEQNVFINCPFDDEYFELLRPLIFTVVYLGFNPRISLESSDSGQFRLDKIVNLIRDSKYSIHDLSRLQAKNVDDYYRLNMPFELGIDYGLRNFDPEYKDKKTLILEKSRFEYMKAISDINGFDLKNHNNNSAKLIEVVRAWFIETVKLKNINATAKISSDFIVFNTNLFNDRVAKYYPEHTLSESDKFANAEISEMSFVEFIDEVRNYLN